MGADLSATRGIAAPGFQVLRIRPVYGESSSARCLLHFGGGLDIREALQAALEIEGRVAVPNFFLARAIRRSPSDSRRKQTLEASVRTATKQRASRGFGELVPYLKALREFPPLTREEERALTVRARKADVAAKQKLVQHNLAFVVAIARKQRRGIVRLDDLIQEGNLGLMRAVEKFDPHAGSRFLTYAAWWIRAYIGKYLKQARSAVRPRSGTVAQPDLSLDSAIDEEGDVSHLERIEDEGPGPESVYLSAEADREVRDALVKVRKRIGELGWDIVHNRLEQDSPKTLDKIGKRRGVSRERVRQVEVQTKEFLRRYLEPLETDSARHAA